MDFETNDKADIKSRLQSKTENDCFVFGDLAFVGKRRETKQFSQFCRPSPQQIMFSMFHPLLKASGLLLKLVFHRIEGLCLKTRRLRSLYVERKMTILWHTIMSHTRGTGAYMFSTKCHGSLYVIKVRKSIKDP